MWRSHKTELKPTKIQAEMLDNMILTACTAYNKYLDYNEKYYRKHARIIRAADFYNLMLRMAPDKNEYLILKNKKNKENVCRAFKNADAAYIGFLKGEDDPPNPKNVFKESCAAFFKSKGSGTASIRCSGSYLLLPDLGKIRLKEVGYLPRNKYIYSCFVHKKAGRYFASVVFDKDIKIRELPSASGLGVDLGIKNLAIVSDGTVYGNINKDAVGVRLRKRIKREQRTLARRRAQYYENRETGKVVDAGKNYKKQTEKVQKAFFRLDSRHDTYIKQCVANLVSKNPSFITMEHLDLKDMKKVHGFALYLQSADLCDFRKHLISKCEERGIELREVDQFYPSSRICNRCGRIKEDLKIEDRVFKCHCGYENDRDLNASLNLRDAKKYHVLVEYGTGKRLKF